MDEFWRTTADFVTKQGFVADEVVAPVEMATMLAYGVAGYANVSASDAKAINALVLHKGFYRELDKGFLIIALARLKPHFANEVFIVLAKGESDFPPDVSHLGALADIEHWALAPLSEDVLDGPAQSSRMNAVYLGGGVILAETADGHLLNLKAADKTITPHILRDGYFDAAITRFLKRTLRPGMIFVDIGANVGVYAVLAAELVGKTGRIVAIEALPSLATLLHDNLLMNGFKERSVVVSCAVAQDECDLEIYEFSRLLGSSSVVPQVVRQAEEGYLEQGRPVKVRGRKLTAILHEASIQKADFVKIDVEGFEFEVLLGARELIETRQMNRFLFEWHPSMIAHDNRARKLYDLVSQGFGFDLSIVLPDGSTRSIGFDEMMRLEHADILAAQASGHIKR